METPGVDQVKDSAAGITEMGVMKPDVDSSKMELTAAQEEQVKQAVEMVKMMEQKMPTPRERLMRRLKFTFVGYMIQLVVFGILIFSDQDEMDSFNSSYEECAAFIWINWFMLALGTLIIVPIVSCGTMKC